jgi:choline/glycine/proline betaine transport protein
VSESSAAPTREESGPPVRPPGFLSSVHPPVFWPALVVLAGSAALGIFFPKGTETFLGQAKTYAVDYVGWFLVLAVAVFVVFSLMMGLSRFGDIKLGPDDEDPEFSMPAWFAMLFAAGMGIGLVFWGVAEPLTYFGDVDRKAGVDGEGVDLAQQVMAQVFVHWGFHAWAIYVVVGLALAYAIHRKGHPVSIRWALEPLLGDRVKGWVGDVIDVLAVVGTVVGVATSLGLGVKQISAGLAHLGVFSEADNTLMVGLIVVITLLATVSVVSGVGKGIKWLSNTNLVLAGLFMVAVLLLGPTMFLLRSWVQELGVYLTEVLQLTFDNSAWTWGTAPETGAGYAGGAWQGGWTIFYWGWWISWAPFVGVFIARISRGRTIREFVLGVLLVPSLVSFLWFTVMGNTAIAFQDDGTADIYGAIEAADWDESVAMFTMLEALPWTTLVSLVLIFVIAVFFVTSSDSGSYVIDMIASGGSLHPPVGMRVFWALSEGVVAAVLLGAGGIMALRSGAIVTGLPFTLVLLIAAVGVMKGLRSEQPGVTLDDVVAAPLIEGEADRHDARTSQPTKRSGERVGDNPDEPA